MSFRLPIETCVKAGRFCWSILNLHVPDLIPHEPKTQHEAIVATHRIFSLSRPICSGRPISLSNSGGAHVFETSGYLDRPTWFHFHFKSGPAASATTL